MKYVYVVSSSITQAPMKARLVKLGDMYASVELVSSNKNNHYRISRVFDTFEEAKAMQVARLEAALATMKTVGE